SSGVVAVAGGTVHSLFTKSDGSAWTTGLDGGVANTNTPQQIISSNVVAIAAGDGYSLFLKSDGSLWGAGDNEFGELGTGTFKDARVPQRIVPGGVVAIAATYLHSLFVKSDGSLWATGGNFDGQLGDGFAVTGVTNRTLSVPAQIVPSPQPRLNISTL